MLGGADRLPRTGGRAAVAGHPAPGGRDDLDLQLPEAGPDRHRLPEEPGGTL